MNNMPLNEDACCSGANKTKFVRPRSRPNTYNTKTKTAAHKTNTKLSASR